LLLRDIPNATMRKRFMASAAGKAYQQTHYGHPPEPRVRFDTPDDGGRHPDRAAVTRRRPPSPTIARGRRKEPRRGYARVSSAFITYFGMH
jgi:hypothetical protein